MIRDLLVRKFAEYGADEQLVDRLLAYGEGPYLTWLVRSMHDASLGVVAGLDTLCFVLNKPMHTVRYHFYVAPYTPFSRLEMTLGYPGTMELIESAYPGLRSLFESLAPCAFRHLQRLAVEIGAERGDTVEAIRQSTGSTMALTYKWRTDFLQRFVDKFGETSCH